MRLPRRHYESYCVLTIDDEPVGEPRLFRRHWTRRAAARWATSIVHTPQVLAMTLQSALTRGDGHMVFANAAVRDARTDEQPQFVYPRASRRSLAGALPVPDTIPEEWTK